MRLIDADELKRSISQNNKIPRIFQQVINSQSTAYDADKVVECFKNELFKNSERVRPVGWLGYSEVVNCERIYDIAEKLKKDFKKGLFAEPYIHYASYNQGYNKAIDDFVNACKENIMYKTFGLRECEIEQIAEQLKEREADE